MGRPLIKCKKCNQIKPHKGRGCCSVCLVKIWIQQKREESGLIKCQCSDECQEMIYALSYKLKPAKYKDGHKPSGENAENWKGGRTPTGKGYIWIYAPNYYRADKRGYVLEHIKAYEDYYKCCILKWGQIHHINEQKDDNRIENLLLTRNGLHRTTYHLKDISDRRCVKCGSNTTTKGKNKIWYYWYCIDKENKKYLCNKCFCKYKRNGKSLDFSAGNPFSL